ncbi:MAG: hypothetical protein IKL87_01785 [Oscillospiraceae bacterium]|nr:hypothetical protein [Oscillospiraceae bacterium]
MEFKIRHHTVWIQQGIVINWFIPVAIFLLYVALGFNIHHKPATTIFLGMLLISFAAEFLFVVLFFIELLYGARIMIEHDHIDIRMLLRRKRISFDQIEKATYYHEGDRLSDLRRSNKGDTPTTRLIFGRRHFRALLSFRLSSGKIICLNDVTPKYEDRVKRAMVDPNTITDEDVRLYQAYQCYRSAADQYAREHGLQIPR